MCATRRARLRCMPRPAGDGNTRLPCLLQTVRDVNARDNLGRTPAPRRPRSRGLFVLSCGSGPIRPPGTVRGTAARSGRLRVVGDVGAFFAFADADIVAGCMAAGVEGHAIADGSRATALLFKAVASTPDPAVVSMLLEAGAGCECARRLVGIHTPPPNRQERHATGSEGAAGGRRRCRRMGGGTHRRLLGGAGPRSIWPPGRTRIPMSRGPCWMRGRTSRPAAGKGTLWAIPRFTTRVGIRTRPSLRALLDAGADIHALSFSGRTPLHEAAANASDPAVIELLVAAGGDVNALDSNGYAPLHSAAWYKPPPRDHHRVDRRRSRRECARPRRARSPGPRRKRPNAAVRGAVPRRRVHRRPADAYRADRLGRGSAGARRSESGAGGRDRPHGTAHCCGVGAPPPSHCWCGWAPIRTRATRTAGQRGTTRCRTGSLQGLPEVRRMREEMRGAGARR